MSLINITHFDWTKLMRLYAVKNVHPMFNYHYSDAIKRLDYTDKGYVKEAVDDYIRMYEQEFDETVYQSFYHRMYPIILIMTGKDSNKYAGIIDEVLPDRHTNELNMTYLMVKTTIADMFNMFRLLAIEIDGGQYFGQEEHQAINHVQSEYKKLFKTTQS